LVVVLRIVAVLAIIAGIWMIVEGFPDGYTVLKLGIALLVVIFLIGLFRISKNSRGTF